MEKISCGALSMGVVGADCDNPLVMGEKPTVTLINHDDIEFGENKTKIEDGIITNLVLKAGAVGYLAQTLNEGISTNVAFAKGAYYSGWDTNLVVRIFDNTPAVKEFIKQLSKSKVVAIVENKYVKLNPKSPEVMGQTVYEAYGFYTGLELNEATKDSTDADTKGGYVLTLGCDENSKEPVLPITVFNTSLESTTQMVNALSTTATP